jgi:thiol-disulfide isomerase/thioredoxin
MKLFYIILIFVMTVYLLLQNGNSEAGGDVHVIKVYKAEWCGHCRNFQPELKLLQKKVNSMPNVELIIYDADRDAFQVAKDNILGFPMIRIDDSDYNGPRKCDAILLAARKST